jgi:hypothetical protein
MKTARIVDLDPETFYLEYDDTRGTKNRRRLDSFTYEKAVREAKTFLEINEDNHDADGNLWELE